MLSFLYFLTALIASLLLTLIAMPWLLRLCERRGLYDMPNERKVHSNKIPRLGGLLFVPAMAVGFALSMLVMVLTDGEQAVPVFRLSTLIMAVGLFLLYLIGILDDLLGLRASFKFLAQAAATAFMPLCGLYIDNFYGFCGIYALPIWVSYPLTVFVCLLIVNSINLIDGIDGLSSGLCILSLSAFALLFMHLNVMTYTLLAAGLVGTLIGFFYFNMFGKVERGTKTFMGDTGTLVLGYAIAYLAIKFAMNNNSVLPYRPCALLVSFTLVAVPTLDLVRVAIGRILGGKGIFHPDKTHIHHRAMAAGYTMHQSLAIILVLQLTIIAINFGGYFLLDLSSNILVPIDLALFASLILWFGHRQRQHATVS
ncbi:MAG: undecaprenyl/decaprenyl-phosphate alpha-N-acetylglucosaminyl 1-phosphate transferase [Bacteroidaceae bacterium]|nr:undecaprenyl/decaprenyl-phosphate alpha-N-acetylglucosaminyl 1-phosphate transferase [Bacteroidaceae bacterium]